MTGSTSGPARAAAMTLAVSSVLVAAGCARNARQHAAAEPAHADGAAEHAPAEHGGAAADHSLAAQLSASQGLRADGTPVSEPAEPAAEPSAHAVEQVAHAEAAEPAHTAEPAWVDLFDGETLDGWASIWGSVEAWGVEDGEIVIQRPGEGGWLRTTKMYRDFELEVDFVIPKGGNSGVGLRASSNGDPAFAGLEVQILDSFGIAPAMTHAGAVYNAIPPAVQAVNPAGDWNSYRIRLVGDTLDVWLNGEHVQRAEKLDDRGIFRRPDQPRPLSERLPTGFIAFQDHGEGGLRLRNIRVRDLSPDPDPGDFTPVFTQADAANAGEIDGWTRYGGGSFALAGGTLVAADGPGHLFSEFDHANIELRAFVRVAPPEQTGAQRTGNSGIYFRAQPPSLPDPWPRVGYEAQIDNHDTRPSNYTGSIYDVTGTAAGQPVTQDGVWFDYRIRAIGDRIQTFINGEPMADTSSNAYRRGFLAFQTHHAGNRVEFQDVQWRIPSAGELE